jgi:aldehyde dehydrogenase (NAD+)
LKIKFKLVVSIQTKKNIFFYNLTMSSSSSKRMKAIAANSNSSNSNSTTTTTAKPTLATLTKSLPVSVKIPTPKYTQLFIDNKFVDAISGNTLDVINPTTEEIICQVAHAHQEDVDLAVEAAKRAFAIGSEWRTMDASVRGELLYRLADLMERDREQLAALESLNNGKAFGDAFNIDMTLAIKCLRYYSGWADKLHGKVVSIDGPFLAQTRREPVGICACIVPWNFPIMLTIWKLAPALCCGNCIIIKPSEVTPLTALAIAALVREAGFPTGVVSVLPGLGKTAGAALARHMQIDKIAFTGSTPVGRLIMEEAAKSNLKNVTLELGGKSPCIVFEDADVEEAVELAHHAIFFNQGQCCAAGSRTYVQDSIFDEFVRKATARARVRITGDPFTQGTEHGPQVNEIQHKKVLGMIQQGVKEGAKLLVGGHRHGNKGYFVEPTVLICTPDNICAREEIFGPVQVLIRFRTLEEVVEMANDSIFGLAAAVITHDLDTALVMSQRLRAGSVWVNCYDVFSAQAPFGGFKQSVMLFSPAIHQIFHKKKKL